VIVLLSAVVGVLFGAGAFLMLKPDLFRVVIGMVMISNAANLTLMASGLTRGRSPIHPLAEEAAVSDPLVQAMTLTAIVIGFGVTALLLSLVYRVYASHETVDLDDLSHQEARQSAELEREEVQI
jgi:multicomponent Na+:H+ antiporter subunit C